MTKTRDGPAPPMKRRGPVGRGGTEFWARPGLLLPVPLLDVPRGAEQGRVVAVFHTLDRRLVDEDLGRAVQRDDCDLVRDDLRRLLVRGGAARRVEVRLALL